MSFVNIIRKNCFVPLQSKRFFSKSLLNLTGNNQQSLVEKINLDKLSNNSIKHVKYLSQFYDDEILSSILKAESVIDPEHYKNRRFNDKQFAPHYLDDLTKLDPYFDHLPENLKQTSYLSMTQPSPIDEPQNQNLPEENEEELTENKQLARKLALATGFNEDYITRLSVRTLILKVVRNQTSKGKISSFYALVCAGDRNGMLGIGEGKDPEEPANAILKAHWQAVKNLRKIPRLENRTIYGQVENKYGSSLIQLRSAPPGFGLRVNHNIYELCQCAGIKDLSGKVFKSRNNMNVVKATVDALLKQKTTEEIALERGKKVVDLRKTYYSAE